MGDQTAANCRRTGRVPQPEALVRIGALDFYMRVLNISAGGFLLDAPLELPRGAVEQCNFLTENGEEIRLRARVVHVLVRRLVTDTSYLTGFEFTETRVETVQHSIAQLLKTTTSGSTHYSRA